MTDADVDVDRLLDASPRYALTDDELEYCRKVARRRDAARDGAGKANNGDGYDGEKWHVRGVVGEYAVAQMCGWEIDDTVYTEGTGDDGYDFVDGDVRMDVKACRPAYADDLLVDEACFDRPEPADLSISVAVDLSEGVAWLVGSATRDMVEARPVQPEPCEWSSNHIVTADDLILPARRESLYGDGDGVETVGAGRGGAASA